MSEPELPAPAPGPTIGAMFDLPPADAALLEEFCREALHDVGVDGQRFFDRLRQGGTFGAALGLTPDIVELIYARAHRWFAIGRFDRAEPLFRSLCVAEGQVADYWIGLGVCLRLRDDLKGAALAFATAARLRPDWAVPAFHASELALRAGDLAGAEMHIRRFRQHADALIPERMLAEIERMATALEMRRAGSHGPTP